MINRNVPPRRLSPATHSLRLLSLAAAEIAAAAFVFGSNLMLNRPEYSRNGLMPSRRHIQKDLERDTSLLEKAFHVFGEEIGSAIQSQKFAAQHPDLRVERNDRLVAIDFDPTFFMA